MSVRVFRTPLPGTYGHHGVARKTRKPKPAAALFCAHLSSPSLVLHSTPPPAAMAKETKKERPGGAAPPRTEDELPRLPKGRVEKKKLQMKEQTGKKASAKGEKEKPVKKAKKEARPKEDAIETNIEEEEDGAAGPDGDDGPVLGPTGDIFEELPEGDLNVRSRFP